MPVVKNYISTVPTLTEKLKRPEVINNKQYYPGNSTLQSVSKILRCQQKSTNSLDRILRPEAPCAMPGTL